jgi:hypothetical protein
MTRKHEAMTTNRTADAVLMSRADAVLMSRTLLTPTALSFGTSFTASYMKKTE